MLTTRRFFGIACRVAAFSFLMAGTASLMQAQQSASAVSNLSAPMMLAAASASAYSSSAGDSSSSADAASDSSASFDMKSPAELNSLQPPPRRRYGRPNYSGGNTNADGSNKYFFLGGIGLTLPLGDTYRYETPSYGFQFGGGRNFNKNIGIGLQFDYDHFGLQGSTLANQTYIYNYPNYEGANCTSAAAQAGYCVQDLDGNNHVWSFTLNPTYTLSTEGPAGAYLVVGAGYYHKVTNFAEPTAQEECSIYIGGCGEYEVDANIDKYTSNAFGVNGGFGLTWKLSHFSNERLYMEARYVLMLNSQRYGYTWQNVATTSYNGLDAYPANSNRTTYVPIKFGLRF
jgi:hypothetical protein